MKKIALWFDCLQDSKFKGGAERFNYELLKRFSENNTVDVYYLENQMESSFENTTLITANGIAEAIDKINLQQYDAAVLSYIAKHNYISFQHLYSRYFRVKKVKKWYELFFSSIFEAKRYWDFERIVANEKECLLSHKKIIVCSEILKKDYVENYQIPADKIKVVYPGVDTADNIDFCNNDVFTFALSAIGFNKKGGFLALLAAVLLKLQGEQFKIKIIYPKWKKNLGVNLLINIFGLSKNIEFVPFQKDMNEFFKSANCILMPSNEETFGMTALEAMAYKRYVIASNCSGVAEIITDGENGFVFDMKNKPVLELYKKMKFALRHKEEYCNICEKAYSTAKEFSWDKVAARFEAELFN